MDCNKIYKKYNCHIIVYKDLLNQKKQLQYNAHIKAYKDILFQKECEKQWIEYKKMELKKKTRIK